MPHFRAHNFGTKFRIGRLFHCCRLLTLNNSTIELYAEGSTHTMSANQLQCRDGTFTFSHSSSASPRPTVLIR